MPKSASTSLGRSKQAGPNTIGRDRANRRARQGFKPKPVASVGFRTGQQYADDVDEPPGRLAGFRRRRDRDDKAEHYTYTRPWEPHRFRRVRARFASAKSESRNAPDPLPVDETPWLELLPDGDVRDRATGRLMSMTNEGVTWVEGEERVQEMNPGGAWPTRGPVLWAMRRIKFDRFAERTRPDSDTREPPTSAFELEGDGCSLWALLRRDPSAIQQAEVRTAMEEFGWPPSVIAELRAQERATKTVKRAGKTWTWDPNECEWSLQRTRQLSLF